MTRMQEIHNNVFNLLSKEHQKNPNDFFFTMRKNNSSNRLEKGYWFHGNDNYLSVSFWAGMDWKNKTPNIYIQINLDKQCLFIFSAKDHKRKLEFANEKVLPILISGLRELNIDPTNKGFENVLIFELGKGDYIQILKDFIHFIKPQIDDAVKQKISENEAYIQSMQEYNKRDDIMGTQEIKDRSEGSRPIDFIWPAEFKKDIDKITFYQRKLKLGTLSENNYFIKKVIIESLGDIRNPLTIEIPQNASWIFLTGENGCGKTTILRAITSIFHKNVRSNYPIFKNARIEFETHVKNSNEEPIAFASYGPSRLISTSSKDALIESNKIRLEPWYGIFHPDGILQGLEELQRIFKNDKIRLNQIVDYLEDMFSYSEKESDQLESGDSKGELIPQLARVNFEKFFAEGLITYQEKDDSNVEYEDFRKFDELASGARSLIALFADIIIKIIDINKNVPDLSNFRAVVVIDEIDIHFHPSMQKQIVEILSSRFPKVQFIVTTHSPVTLLGAPENSVFYKINRSVENGITAEKLDIDISNLLPNSILSSPIFGFENITSVTHQKGEVKINTEDLYEDLLKNKSLKLKLKEIARKLEERENDI
ncbi:MAG: AAA family ATPase [Lentimicrobium sp.]